MTRLGVLVVRRIITRVNGRKEITELSRAVELAIPPVPGMVLSFADGSPDCTVSWVRHRVGVTPAAGVVPVEVELVCTREPETVLEACLARGWAPVRAPE